ncbi:hypothetical protein DSL72_004907 [Monilinia vaccinii-corymbosi]|uniref:Uncharacterized protein n=1 Tax=Monilinia vaccinii-corymbosi TaxID=61207 RepID=A0A8A3P3A4_9HELO|nr:hypothetical protein DSL72_004907 [Monilinia vaccinii-corymbosi]
MPRFLSPKKAKPPVPIDTEQQVANSHYYTAFKIILKITVIALVICIAFLPTVPIRNKERQNSDKHVVKDLEHPVNFDISTELERQVTHVPLRYIKAGKLMVQQLRIRGSKFVDLSNISADEQVERSKQVTDDTADGIQSGDYTLGGSTHEAKYEREPIQQCPPDIRSWNGGVCPRPSILPIRDDDRVVSGRCSWQERRKRGGRCELAHWQPTPRSLIMSEDLHPVEPRGNDDVSRPTTLSLSTSTTPELRIIASCSYESKIRNGGRCPHGLANGQAPAENKPVSITVKKESRVSNKEPQIRDLDVLEEAQDITAAYRAESCQSPWIHTNDGWCIYKWGDDSEPLQIHFPEDTGPGQLSPGESDSEENKGIVVAYQAGSCPSTWIHTADGWCIYTLRDNDEPLKISFPEPLGLQQQQSKRGLDFKTQTILALFDASSADSCPHPWFYAPHLDLCGYGWQNVSDPLQISSLGPQQQPPGRPDPRKQNIYLLIPRWAWATGKCPATWFEGPLACYYTWEEGTDPLTLSSPSQNRSRGGNVMQRMEVASTLPDTTTPAASISPPKGAACLAPWIRTMDGRCFFDPNYEREHPHDPLSQPRKPRPQLRDNVVSEERGVAPHRRGFWPEDWVPQIAEDCDRFPVNSLAYHECIKSVAHKNTGLKLIMFFLILAGLGSLVFLIITCANKATRPKAQPFRQVDGTANGMMAHPTSMCGHYPWSDGGNLKPMNGERWPRGPPTYDPMRQFSKHHSNDAVVCSRARNCASVGSGSQGTENWIRKLCNRCFKSGGSSTSDPSQISGIMENGLLSPRIDTLQLPNADLATAPGQQDGRVGANGSGGVRGQSAESTETVVLGNEYGSLLCEEGSGSGRGSAAVGIAQDGNLGGDKGIEPEAAMMKCGKGKGSGSGNLKLGNGNAKVKKVEFERLEELDLVEPLKVEKENRTERASSIVFGSGS